MGGEGHIAQMISVLKRNRSALYSKRKGRKGVNIASKKGKLTFNKMTSEQLNSLKKKMILRRKRDQLIVITALALTALLSIYFFFHFFT